ncbi:Ig-like domain-containing protein [Clostridium sp. DL1XJH146]
MNRKFNFIKILIIALVIVLISSVGFVSAIDKAYLADRYDVSNVKSWKITFSEGLDRETIEGNIKVVNSEGQQIDVKFTLLEDSKTLVIDPPAKGYKPNSVYYLKLNANVKSVNGKKLEEEMTMKFVPSNNYNDATNDENLPMVQKVNTSQSPVIANSNIDFNITSNTDASVQYRVYIFKYPNNYYDAPNQYTSTNYSELTAGFTGATSGTSSYKFSVESGLSTGKYQAVVYVRRANEEGSHKNELTDYDNYYTYYFNVLDKNIIATPNANETITYTNYTKTLEEAAVNQFSSGLPVNDHGSTWVRASKEIIKYYMNPSNFIDDYGKYQFLDLHYMEGVTVEDLNGILAGKGVLEGKGEVFLNAAKDNNINPIYLISHSLLETNNGKSVLVSGIEVSEVDGNAVEAKVAYNAFAVHAYDDNPNKYGSEYAYQQGWFTVDDAIKGGAAYIGSGYINNAKYNQNTIYKMRYNIETSWHQYATDIGWAYKQIKNIKTLMDSCTGAKPVFEIPVFK